MSWFSKKLKKITNTVDPVGKYLRRSTGGSYMDPMNWYNSKPNTAPAYQPSQSQGLMSAPNGQQRLGTINIGGDSGGRTYVPNHFQNPMPQNSVPGLTAPMGGKSNALPAGPVKGPAMGFGGGVAPQGNMQRMTGYNPLQGTQLANSAQNIFGQALQGAQQPQQLGQQQAMIRALRGRMM
jgi:hypothetical protein